MIDYVEILPRRKRVIIITLLVFMVMAVAATLIPTPSYRASMLLRVLSVSGGGSADWVAYDTGQLERLINTYAETATSRPVLAELRQRIGLADAPSEEWPRIEVERLPGTELMRVIAEAQDPVVARDAADTLAEILIEQNRSLYIGSGKTAQQIFAEQVAQAKADLDQVWSEYEALLAQSPGDADRIAGLARSIELKEQTYATLLEQYDRYRVREAVLANTLSVVEQAAVPESPSTPGTGLVLALGLVVGAVVGVGLALMLEALDTRLYTADQIQKVAGLPILGEVPAAPGREQNNLFGVNSPQAEAFRRLRTNLLTRHGDATQGALLVTSAEPREGKSTIVANLAFSVAQSGHKVLVVDANLRLPSQHKLFNLSNRVGLSSVLMGNASLKEAVQNSAIEGVHVLTSGPLPRYPAELLSSPRMDACLEELPRQYDMVLLDSPSLVAVTDAAPLAQNADGVLLVAGCAQARHERVRAGRQDLVKLKAEVLGLVVNRSRPRHIFDYYYQLPARSLRRLWKSLFRRGERPGQEDSRSARDEGGELAPQPRRDRAVSRSAFRVMVGGLLSLVAGLGTQVVVAAIFGTSAEMDAYLTALVVPGYLEAVLLAGLPFVFVPAFVRNETTGREEEAWALAGTFVWVTGAILTVAAIAGAIFSEQIIALTAPGWSSEKADLAARMLAVLMFTVPLMGLGSLTRGIENARDRFLFPAGAAALGSLGNVAALLVLYPIVGPLALAWGFLISELLRACVTIVPVLRHGWDRLMPLRDHRVREMARLMLPFMLFGLITRSTLLFERYFASALPDGDLSYLGYAQKVGKIATALLGTGIATAIFPAMARAHTKDGTAGLVEQVEYGFRLTVAVALPSLAIMSALAIPLVTVLYERGAFGGEATLGVSQIIPIVVMGAVVFTMVGNLMSRTFYVIKDTVTVPVVSAVTTILYIFLARFLANTWGYVGLAAAQPLYSGLAIIVLAVILVMRLRSLHTGRLLRDLLMYAAASGAAFAAAWFVSSVLATTPALVQLIVAGTIAGLVYVALAFLVDRNIALSILDMMGVQTLLGRLGWPRMAKPHVADSVPKANR